MARNDPISIRANFFLSLFILFSMLAPPPGYSMIYINIPKEKWAALGDPTEVYLYVDPKDVMIVRP